MKYLKNYQNEWKGRPCEHVYSVVDDNYGSPYQKCIKCFRFIENRENEY